MSRNATTLRYKRKFGLNFFITHPLSALAFGSRAFLHLAMSARLLVSTYTCLLNVIDLITPYLHNLTHHCLLQCELCDHTLVYKIEKIILVTFLYTMKKNNY